MLDTTFDSDAKQIIDFGATDDFGYGVAVDSQDRALIGGSSRQVGTGANFAVARLTAAGALDAGFDSDGKQTIDFGSANDEALGVTVDSQDRVLLGGYSLQVGTGYDFALARLLSNEPPTANAGGPYMVDEGTPLVLNAAGSSDPDQGAASLTFEWDLNYDGSTFDVDATGVAPSVTFADNFAARTVAVRVTDSDGANEVATTTLTVNNVAPTLTISGNSSVNEGSTYTLNLAASDPGAADTISKWTINWGDGISMEDVSGSAAFNLNHTYADNGNYIITVQVTDDDGGVGTDQVMVTVNNVPPTASAGADQTVSEGDLVSLDGSFSDPGSADTHTFLWQVSASNGQVIANGTGEDFSFTPNDNGTYTIDYTVTDDDGGDGTDQVMVTVNNVPPTVSGLALSDTIIDEGGSTSLSGTISDPGTADTFSVEIDWNGDGSVDETHTGVAPGAFSYAHTYLDDNPTATPIDTYTVGVTVTDDDGGTAKIPKVPAFKVNNVAPTVNAGADDTIDEGSAFSGSGSFSDPGADTWTATVDYGDGSGVQGLALNADKTFNLNHIYADNGNYTVTVQVTDDDTGIGTDTLAVAVNNVAPANVNFDNVTFGTLIAAPTVGGVRGQTLLFTGAFTDAGTLDAHSATVDWGDGMGTQALLLLQGAGTGTISGNHIYVASGAFTIAVSVTDDDGGTATETFQVVLANAALFPDTCQDGQFALYVGGTTDADDIRVTPGGNIGDVEVTINGVSEGTFAPTGRIVVFGQAGDDDIQLSGSIANSAWLYGGQGNDRLKSGAGNDVIVGEDGDDLLVGGSGRDLLIGGHGSDRIIGNSDDDILIAGWLEFTGRKVDQPYCEIMRVWTSADDYQTRTANLNRNGLLLVGQTVLDDVGDRDVLTGSAGIDWFFFDLDNDKATDLKDEVFANDLDWILSTV